MVELFWSCMRHLDDAVSKTGPDKTLVSTHSSEQYNDWSSRGMNCFSQIMLQTQKSRSAWGPQTRADGVICRNGISPVL
jgi:hypothetical protein